MRIRILLACTAAVLMAAPALAVLKDYGLDGDQSTKFPTDGTINRPGTVSGPVLIADPGGGSVTLLQLRGTNAFTDIVGGTITSMIPGTTVELDVNTSAGPDNGQGGSGSTASSTSWGSLTGWTQTGRLVCTTNCPGGCPAGVSSCIPFVGFEGTGPPAPLKATAFTFDPWDYEGDMSGFTAPSFEIVELVGGAVEANLQYKGTPPAPDVPALPLLGIGGLGAALVYLGARGMRRK